MLTQLLFALVLAQTMPTAEEMSEIAKLVSDSQSSYATLGWLGLIGTLVYGLLRVFRIDFFQSRLPGKARWANWHPVLRFFVVFLSSLISVVLLALAGGGTFGVALIVGAMAPAIGAGVSALAVRQTEKLVPVIAKLGISERAGVNLKTKMPGPGDV